MAPLLPNLIVRRTAAKQTPLTNARNSLAVRSALLRGDRVVTLHNTSRILPEHVDNIRVPYHPMDMEHDRLFEWPFGDQYGQSRSSHSFQPKHVDRYIGLLEWDGFRLEWIRVLGQGGFGMATLWHVIFEDQSSIRVVIKIPVRANSDFDDELDWHLRYGGASHVTQSLDIQAMADKVRRNINRGHMIGRGARFVQTNMEVLVLEYAERGSLYDMMAKASYFNIRFSNKVLWEIWECLVKGAVSAALQPDAARRWGPGGLDKVLDSLDDVRNVDELIRICTLIDSHDVHFDIEEQNVLIAENDQHSHHPIFKLHDFGEFSHKMRESWANWKEEDYWKVRKCPKSNRIPPETITKDWDKIDLSNPGPVSRFAGENFCSPQNETAGRYGTWTNLFMIAKMMEAVITRNWVGHPMTTMSYTAYERGCTGNSYGWRLCRREYEYIEADLLDLVLQCQFEKPADRPSLVYLLSKICSRKYRGFMESDDETCVFWDDFWALTKKSPNPLWEPSIVEVPGAGQGNHPKRDASLSSDTRAENIMTAMARRKSHRSPLSISGSTSSADFHHHEAARTDPAFVSGVPSVRRKSQRSPLDASSAGSSMRFSHQRQSMFGAGPAFNSRVPSLRRKSRRSPLSLSSAESSMRFSHQRQSIFGQAVGSGRAGAPSLRRRSRRLPLSVSSSEELPRGAREEKRVRFGGYAASTSQNRLMSGGSDAMDISIGGVSKGDTPEGVNIHSFMDLDENEGGDEAEAMEEDEEDDHMSEDSW